MNILVRVDQEGKFPVVAIYFRNPLRNEGIHENLVRSVDHSVHVVHLFLSQILGARWIIQVFLGAFLGLKADLHDDL